MPTDNLSDFFVSVKQILLHMVMMPDDQLRGLRDQVLPQVHHADIPELAAMLAHMVDEFLRAGDDQQRRDQLGVEFWDRLSQMESLMRQRRAAPEAGASHEEEQRSPTEG